MRINLDKMNKKALCSHSNGSGKHPLCVSYTLKQVSILLYSSTRFHSIETIRIQRGKTLEAGKMNAY